MPSIYFAGTYEPIVCGIADYTSYLTRESPSGKWGALSFNLRNYPTLAPSNNCVCKNHTWYGIPSTKDFSSSAIWQGLKKLNANRKDAVLWVQHEFGIWANDDKLVAMLMELDIPKVISFHTLHFQSAETPSGLRTNQYNLLQQLLPHVDAITVFSRGVYYAVISAFPQYFNKVHIVKHGVHLYPKISRMTRPEARQRLLSYLLHEADLDHKTSEQLYRQRTLLGPNAIVIGQTGFLSPLKQSESLFEIRDKLQAMLPEKKLTAIRIGSPRDNSQKAYIRKLRDQNGSDQGKLLIETLLPHKLLPLAQRAFDINFYWPNECTQSGVMAHALGTGAVIAGRDLEGVGETLKEAGQIVDTDIDSLLNKMRDLIAKPEIAEKTEGEALKYASHLCWKKQSRRHYELAADIVRPAPAHTLSYPSLTRIRSTSVLSEA